jgi:hypothetical protein
LLETSTMGKKQEKGLIIRNCHVFSCTISLPVKGQI